MNAAIALDAARVVGLSIDVDGDDLVLQASVPPPVAVIDLLSLHKAAIVALLRPGRDGWSAEDWQGYCGERAGIAEFDGGLPRERAEAVAFACCATEWSTSHKSGRAEAVAALASMGIAMPTEFPDDFGNIGWA